MREKSNSLFKQNSQQPHVFRGGEIKVMKKKIAAFVLATALVLPLSVPAFAATPSDVVGKPVQSAVEELTALGIIAGYEDGTFKPENTITRAELAKVIVIGSGNEGAAKLMESVKPTFKDVKANVWYTGYINAAATKGFILGDAGTKNFRPSDAVKFEEVVAVLVRSLGYQEKKLSGVWPYNYLLKAQDLGLFNNVDLNVGAKALRGVVAQLTSNTLNAKLVSYNVDGNEVLSSNTLISKLGNTSSAELLSDAVVDGKVTLRWVTGKDKDDKDIVKYEGVAVASNFIVTGNKSLVDLLGNNVTVVKGKDGKVLAITDAQSSDTVLKGTFVKEDAGKITIKVGSKEETKSTVGKSVYFVNGEVKTAFSASVGDDVTLFLDGNDVRVATSEKWAAKDSLVTLVEEKNSYRDAKVTYSNGTSLVSANASVTLDGKVAKVTDLKKDDVISVVEKTNDQATKVVAVRSTTTGKLENVGATNGVSKFTIAGKVYEATSNVVLANINTLIAANIGKEFTLILNAEGKIVKASAPEAAVNTPAVIVLDAIDAKILENEQIVDRVKVTYFDIKANKNEIKYTTAPLATFTAVKDQVSVLAFDGAKLIGLAKDEVKTDVKGAGIKVESVTAAQVNLDGNVSFVIDANTVVVDATKLGATNLDDRKLAVGTLAQVTKGDLVYVHAKGATASYIVIKKDTDASATVQPTLNGLFVSASINQSTTTSSTYSAVVKVAGVDKDVKITGDVYLQIKGYTVNSPIKLVDTADTSVEYDVASNVSVNVATVSVKDQPSNTFVDGNAKYIVTGNTTVYVISADNKSVNVGGFTDVSEQAGTLPNTKVASITVTESGTSFNGFKEAAVVIVKLK